jgi:hypothetical protein
MAATCSGQNGEPCGCQQFDPREDKPHKCSGCKHPKSFHPPTMAPPTPAAASKRTVDDILDQYGGLDRLRPKTSRDEARKETNAGLKSNKSKTSSKAAGKSRVGIIIDLTKCYLLTCECRQQLRRLDPQKKR